MSMRHKYCDSKGRIAPSIMKGVGLEAISLGLGEVQSHGEKNARFVLNHQGRSTFNSFIEKFLYKESPVEFTTNHKVRIGEILGDEIVQRDLINGIRSAKATDDWMRVEIRFDHDKEKQRVLLDTIENAVSHIKAKTGNLYNEKEMIAASVQLVFEGLVDYKKNSRSDLFPQATETEVFAHVNGRMTKDDNAPRVADEVGFEQVDVFNYEALYLAEKGRRERAESQLETAKFLARQILAIGRDDQ